MTASERLKQILEEENLESSYSLSDDIEGSMQEWNMGGKSEAKNIKDSNLNILHALSQREVIQIMDRVLGGEKFEIILEEVAREYLGEDWATTATGKSEKGYISETTVRSEAEDFDMINGIPDFGDDEAYVEKDFLSLSKNVPLRINHNERQLLKLVEGTLEVSKYTDRVDVGSSSRSKMIVNEIRQVCAILSGLTVSFDYELGQRLIRDRCFSENERFFQTIFEIARRYKMLNPEMMRDTYGKLVFLLMDAQKESIRELLQFKCYKPVLTVYEFLKSKNRLDILSDPLLSIATRNIEQEDDISSLNAKLTRKRLAIKELLRRYSSRDYEQNSKKSASRGFYGLFMLGRSTPTPGPELNNQSGIITSTGNLESFERTQDEKEITVEELETCIYSLNDHDVFLYYNKRPIDKMIEYLTTFFSPNKEQSKEFSLSLISDPNSTARLSHDHSRQYYYVLQSLTMWREVIFNMIRLWRLAEEDLLDGNNGYRLGDTGQGIHRIQPAPRLYRAMCEIISRVQHQVGNWVGSSVIHLGDRTVPNALVFIDKYLQVPKILTPIVLCIEKIDKLSGSSPHLKVFIENSFGGVVNLKKQILVDFFKYGFDGGGADNFFDAGSCIDGRLTSAWNWCSNIEKKPYFPIFLLTGFVGFDGKF
ncbi:putative adenylosuccinate lyase [Cryptosporidium felis]|nr:putative adenylosuccinate lyase [Cryptosporidium felis]